MAFVSSRFDYLQYDTPSQLIQAAFKEKFIELETMIASIGATGRSAALAFTALEETYMWIGKAVRDAQVARAGQIAINEQRGNS